MMTLTLGNGMQVRYDDQDHEKVAALGWYAVLQGRVWYAHSTCAVPKKIHRYITDAPDGVLVDHRDGDGLNNCRSNLRVCTRAQNAWNANAHADSTSGFKGVTYDKSNKTRNPWRANICKDGVRYRLGRFPTAEAASVAYNEAAKKLFGEFARLN